MMKTRLGAVLALATIGLVGGVDQAQAANCLEVTLAGTQGGPPVFNGLAGSGTLVRYGTEQDNCSATILQFDAGRGTLQRLSEVNVPVGRVRAIFITHIHSDHVDGLADLMQVRWHFASQGPKVDLVCSADAASPAGHVMNCTGLATHIGDAYIQSGEMAQREGGYSGNVVVGTDLATLRLVAEQARYKCA